MGWFKKKPDPISERARALNEEIAALELQIRKLNAKPEPTSTTPAPRLRSTAMPHGAATTIHTPHPQPAPPAAPHEPIFEEVDQNRLQAKTDPETTPEHYNDLGVRKYDLTAFLGRLKNNFRGPSTANPKLVNYLAAGSIQGLRPMRYEKRVARNRFLFVVIGLLLVLVGFFAIIYNRR
jgi:hypothetical protein